MIYTTVILFALPALALPSFSRYVKADTIADIHFRPKRSKDSIFINCNKVLDEKYCNHSRYI
ncbi:hypothetical protein DSO57_1023681 [Entomophthora muscae]|uniref:Uncharacterized protein n=2 Tax=Entomophthora muscae TaxID=34485 RepID=A0ACC2T350_9FUNG|nr:hypothetical protein DSO57_1015189 [Entomophthora muscae]KAJ9068925.1 hypothetical protein DSO57_1023681 [Entomophthora muscae]